VAFATAVVPLVARRSACVHRFQSSVSSEDERYGGLVWYTLAYAVLTWIGLSGPAFPAAAALLALSLGDGIGGAVGRRYGYFFYRAPRGKRKSFEGTFAVFVAATAGAALAGLILGVSVSPALACMLGAVAAFAEATAPRGADNVVVPAFVFFVAFLFS
jgi:dolichol kinase